MKNLSRILFAIAALLLAFGTYVHTSAFGRISTGVAKSDLPDFLGKGLRVLWLQDSAIQLIFAIIFAVLAIKPAAAPRWIVIMLSVLLLTTVASVYYFIGNFIAGHLFLAAAVTAILGTLLSPRSN